MHPPLRVFLSLFQYPALTVFPLSCFFFLGFWKGLKAYARSIHRHVDEEEDGLNFGAPLISDGDSIYESESRTRSPENIENQRDRRKLGSPLIVLLNQGSRKFHYVDRPSSLLYDDNNAAKLDSSPDTHSADGCPPSHGYRSIRRTPQYIASLLRRSLRGVGKDQWLEACIKNLASRLVCRIVLLNVFYIIVINTYPIHTYIDTYTYIHTYIYIYIYIYTYILTYIYKYTYTSSNLMLSMKQKVS